MSNIHPSTTAELVDRARAGDEDAWTELVQTFDPLITSITRRYRLSCSDADDVHQTVWTRLVHCIDGLREPRALPGWISTTTSRECLQVVQQWKRSTTADPTELRADQEADVLGVNCWVPVDDNLLRIERQQAVQRGLAELTPTQRQLLLLLVQEPAVTYREISKQIGMPMGSIGPTRARLLKRLSDSVEIQQVDDRFEPAELALV